MISSRMRLQIQDRGDDALFTEKDVMDYFNVSRGMLRKMTENGFLSGGFLVGASKRWRFESVRRAALGSLDPKDPMNNVPVAINGRALLGTEDLENYLSCKRSDIARSVSNGEMPSPVLIGDKKRWRASEVAAWIEGRKLPGVCQIRRAVRPHINETKVADRIPKGLEGIADILMEYSIEKQHCVYFLVKGEEVVYVGSSFTLFSRIDQHKSKDFDRVFYFNVVPDRMLAIESEMIRLLRPKLNIVGNLLKESGPSD